ncbi:MAG: flagellar motor stator protein MotA [Legionellales bacterium]
MLVLIGYIIIIASVFGGFALGGGHLLALMQPLELLMIGGAALGSFIVANSINTIKTTFKAVFSTMRGFGYEKKFYIQLLSILFEITNKIKKEGPLSIEADIENYRESEFVKTYPLVKRESDLMEFMCDHLRIIITGRVNSHMLESLIDQDIESFICEKEQAINAINKVADSLPAFGIVAAVMGVVHTMESMAGVPPDELGGLIAKAMVGTFLGVLLGYGFIAPIGALLEQQLKAMEKSLHAIKIALIATANNLPPSIAVEFGRKILYSKERPDVKALEEIIRLIKQDKTETTP